jgi:hypothetical protein
VSPVPQLPPTGFVDPHGLGPAIDRLNTQSKRNGKVAFGIVSALLREGELVECIARGTYLGRTGVCAVTDQRILVVNDNEWKPDSAELAYEAGLTVQGWADDRSAALVFNHPAGWQVVLDKISEKELAQEMAQRVRAKIPA